MDIKLYLDTSIPSAYFDYSKPVRQLITQKWFENDASLFELYISVITDRHIPFLNNVNDCLVKKRGLYSKWIG